MVEIRRIAPERVPSGPACSAAAPRARGFTLVEAVVVLAIIGLMVAFAIPNMARARVRAIMLGQVKQVRQALMVARIDAIRGGRQTVLGLSPELGRPGLLAWRDDDGDRVHDAGEGVVGRWVFAERVTVTFDPADPLLVLSGPMRGVVFQANGTAFADHAGNATGTGAFLVTDRNGNRFQVSVQGGSGSVTDRMWDPNGSEWSPRFVHWRY